jgi:hypothetical protein
MSATAIEAGATVQEPAGAGTDPATAPPAAAPEGGGAPAASGKKGSGKESKDKKAKTSGSKSAKDVPDASGSPSVAAHPRAARSVARAKGWGGLAGFVIAGYLSLPTGTLADAGLRALVAGSVCYVVAWAGAVFVWRRLVVLEIKSREQQLLAAAQLAGGRLESSPTSAERPNARVA